MLILLSTSSSDENYNGDCDVAVIDMDLAYAKVLLRRLDLVKTLHAKTSDIDSIEFVDYAPLWLAASSLPSDLDEVGDYADGPLVVPEGIPAPNSELGQRTDCDRCSVSTYGVQFTCCPKHSENITVYADSISREQIEGWIATLKGSKSCKR